MAKNKKNFSLALKLGTSFVSIIVFLLLAEFVLSLVNPDLFYKNQFFPLNRDIDFPGVYKKDPDLFWRFHTGITTESRKFSYLDYHINSLGLRGPEIEDSPGYRVIALGNSCTFGWGVAYRNTWPYLLLQALNERFPSKKIEVINAGVPGYSSYQGKIYFARELINLKPDMLLIMFGWNDQCPAGKNISDAEQEMPPSFVLGLQNLVSKTRFYRLLRKAILTITEKQSQVRLDQISGKKRVDKKEFYDNLEEIIKTARLDGIIPVLLVPPAASVDIYFGGGLSDFHTRHRAYQDEIVKVSQYTRVPVVNLQETFDRYDNLFDDARADPVHFNEYGQRVAAETVAKAIIPLIEKN